jgi:hypothetical protein
MSRRTPLACRQRSSATTRCARRRLSRSEGVVVWFLPSTRRWSSTAGCTKRRAAKRRRGHTSGFSLGVCIRSGAGWRWWGPAPTEDASNVRAQPSSFGTSTSPCSTGTCSAGSGVSEQAHTRSREGERRLSGGSRATFGTSSDCPSGCCCRWLRRYLGEKRLTFRGTIRTKLPPRVPTPLRRSVLFAAAGPALWAGGWRALPPEALSTHPAPGAFDANATL